PDFALRSDSDILSSQELQQGECVSTLERTPRRTRSYTASKYGGNSLTHTVVTFLKGMVGSYVLYLPRLFAEGGILFSAASLALLAIFST
ncbi:unnamed protein product, partial [Sphacelaria rigidula]